MTTAFSLPYLGSIGFYSCILNAENPVFDIHEHFVKQSPRNRCFIESPEGITKLTIPLEKSSSKISVKDLQISYQQEWQKDHWRSICSTYNSSAFFQFYNYLFEEFYIKEYKWLVDFNLSLHQLVLTCLKVKLNAITSGKYIEAPDLDFRMKFNHKDPTYLEGVFPHYHQVFHAEKIEFVKNLSIIDLLFNEGPESLSTLSSVQIETF